MTREKINELLNHTIETLYNSKISIVYYKDARTHMILHCNIHNINFESSYYRFIHGNAICQKCIDELRTNYKHEEEQLFQILENGILNIYNQDDEIINYKTVKIVREFKKYASNESVNMYIDGIMLTSNEKKY